MNLLNEFIQFSESTIFVYKHISFSLHYCNSDDSLIYKLLKRVETIIYVDRQATLLNDHAVFSLSLSLFSPLPLSLTFTFTI